MLSMQYIIFPVILRIGGITTQFTDEEAETLRLTVLTEVTEPGLSDIRAHVFSCYATRIRTPPRPCCPWPGKLELFLRAGWGMCSPGGCLSHKQLAVGWEMSLPWNRANENMGQETIIIVSHCVNVWCGSGGHNRFQSHTGGLWLLAVSIYAPSPVPPDLWYGSLSGYPWLLQTTAALSPCPGGTGKQLYQRNEEASSPQWLWVFK